MMDAKELDALWQASQIRVTDCRGTGGSLLQRLRNRYTRELFGIDRESKEQEDFQCQRHRCGCADERGGIAIRI